MIISDVTLAPRKTKSFVRVTLNVLKVYSIHNKSFTQKPRVSQVAQVYTVGKGVKIRVRNGFGYLPVPQA